MKETFIKAEDEKIFCLLTPETPKDLATLRTRRVDFGSKWEDWLHSRRLAKHRESGDNGNTESEEMKT